MYMYWLVNVLRALGCLPVIHMREFNDSIYMCVNVTMTFEKLSQSSKNIEIFTKDK